jgi:hypothetical protein
MEEGAIFSAIVLAGMFALFFGASFMVDRKALRLGTLVSLGVLLLAAVFGVMASWSGYFGLSWRQLENLLGAAGMILLLGLPAGGLLLLDSFRPMRWAVRAYAITCGATIGGVAIIMFLTGPYSTGRQETSVLNIYLTGTLVSFCFLGWGVKRTNIPRWLGVAFAAVGGTIMWIAILQDNHSVGRVLGFLMVTSWILALAAIHAVIVCLVDLKPSQIWMRWTTLGLGWLAALLAFYLAYTEFNRMWSSDIRVVARICATATIFACGFTIGLLIQWRLNRRTEMIIATVPPANFADVDLTCPNCGKRGKIPAGKSACVECGLRFEIKFEEPRCAGCGYLLYHTKAPNCPECGLPIAENAGNVVPPSPDHAFPVAPRGQ